MEPGRIPLRRPIALPFLGQNMDQYRLIQPPGLLQDPPQPFQVMAVHRPQVNDPHILKQHPRDQKLFNPLFCPADLIYDPWPCHRDLFQQRGHIFFQVIISASRADAPQILGNAPHIFGNGHIVVI